MYSNIGGKIKGLAKLVAIIGMVAGALWLDEGGDVDS